MNLQYDPCFNLNITHDCFCINWHEHLENAIFDASNKLYIIEREIINNLSISLNKLLSVN